jgi:hypothetical protein
LSKPKLAHVLEGPQLTVSALQVVWLDAVVVFTSSAAVVNRLDVIDFGAVGCDVVGVEADFDSVGKDVGVVELGVDIIFGVIGAVVGVTGGDASMEVGVVVGDVVCCEVGIDVAGAKVVRASGSSNVDTSPTAAATVLSLAAMDGRREPGSSDDGPEDGNTCGVAVE